MKNLIIPTGEPPAARCRDPHEDPARLQSDLEHLREWLSKQPHLRARTDDRFLATFLRGCKYSLERAKHKMDAFYTLRSALPEFFQNRDPLSPQLQEIIKKGFVLPLGLDTKGRHVVLVSQLPGFDPKKMKTDDIYKVVTMILETILEEDDGAVIAKGQVMLCDVSGVYLAQVLAYTPALVKKIMTVVQEAYPIRPKSMDFFEMPPVFESLFHLFQSFLKEKIRKRIHVHSNMETVTHVPKEILPEEYGGDGGTLQQITERWRKKLEERREWFLEEQQYGVDESKRPGKPKTHSDLFGIEGSFRQLNVD